MKFHKAAFRELDFPKAHPFWIETLLTNAAATAGDILVVTAREILKSIATDELELDLQYFPHFF